MSMNKVSPGTDTTEWTLAQRNTREAKLHVRGGALLALAGLGLHLTLREASFAGLVVLFIGAVFAALGVLHMTATFAFYARSRAGVKAAAADAEKPIVASHVSYAQDIRRSV